MTSPAQITANRVNARLSTGPRTVEGKARSSRNRLTHGLCGAHTVLPGEDPADYEFLLEALLEEHNPAGPTETLLVAQLAQAQWKLNRIAAIEADLFAKQLLPNPDVDMALPVPSGNAPLQYEPNLADAFEKATASLAALARHEAAARRAFDRALSNLWKLQGPRRRDDATRAAQSEAYVKAPMPEQRRESNGAAPSDNSNPICDTEPAVYDQEPSPITRKATPV